MKWLAVVVSCLLLGCAHQAGSVDIGGPITLPTTISTTPTTQPTAPRVARMRSSHDLDALLTEVLESEKKRWHSGIEATGLVVYQAGAFHAFDLDDRRIAIHGSEVVIGDRNDRGSSFVQIEVPPTDGEFRCPSVVRFRAPGGPEYESQPDSCEGELHTFEDGTRRVMVKGYFRSATKTVSVRVVCVDIR